MKQTLVKILQSQGFGSRKECTWMIKKSGVKIDGEECRDPKQLFETDDLTFEVTSQKWTFRPNVYLVLNKPKGYECSHTPDHHESVFELLPVQFINRKIQIAGRLDVDTEGLLLLSDDGQFIHHVTSPKKGVRKTYLADLKHPFSDEQKAMLVSGVELHQEHEKLSATEVEAVSERQVRLTIDRGCYHQVRRMFGAVSNRVEGLKREKVGELSIGDDLPPGEWRYLEAVDLERLKWVP